MNPGRPLSISALGRNIGQTLRVISQRPVHLQWTPPDNAVVVHHYRDEDIDEGFEFLLTVHDGQVALFALKETVFDSLEPGLFRLNVDSIPGFFAATSWPRPGLDRFPGALFFVATTELEALPWSLPEPMPFADPELGAVLCQASGRVSVQVTDSARLVRRLLKTKIFTNRELSREQLLNLLIFRIRDAVYGGDGSLEDIIAKDRHFLRAVESRLSDALGAFGIRLIEFSIDLIKVQERIRENLERRAAARGQPSQVAVSATSSESTAASGTADMELDYYIAVDDKERGPFRYRQIARFAEHGILVHETLVWRVGLADWQPASDLPELEKLLARSP